MATKADRDGPFRRPLYIYDLPPEVLNSQLLLKQDIEADARIHSRDDTDENATVLAAAANSDTTKSASQRSPGSSSEHVAGAQACSLCGLSFTSVLDQRSHLKSDLHNYNLKQKLRGRDSVSEADFEKLIENLDESLSGSDSEEVSEDDDGRQESTLSALLKKQARIASKRLEAQGPGGGGGGGGHADDDETGGKPGKSKPPMIWFSSPTLPQRTYFGIYRAVLAGLEELEEQHEQQRRELEKRQKEQEKQSGSREAKGKEGEEGKEEEQRGLRRRQQGAVVDFIRAKQLEPLTNAQLKPAKDGSLPAAGLKAPHFFLCMIGGGHFAAMIVSLAPRANRAGTTMDREATVLAHKTFHRYTTRRKQGGSQSANDNAKGKANSAGSTLRRYNEQALVDDVRNLLEEWKGAIDSSELLFVRATGTTNRRTLFGPYDGQVLRQTDARIRGFPFSTRRATQNELMRSFIELTRLKVQEFQPPPPPPLPKQAPSRKEGDGSAATKSSGAKPAKARPTEEEETALLHTSQLQALLRRSKLPALLSYLSNNEMTADFEFYPREQNRHAPRPLHLAASQNSAPLVLGILVKARADPAIRNADGRTAFELAGERAVRDAFRVARSELGEGAWDWDAARVPPALTRDEAERREERERAEADKKEAERRRAEEERLAAEGAAAAAAAAKEGREGGKGRATRQGMMGGAYLGTPQERREDEMRGLTPEMKMRLERERRARAAEERIRKMQAGR